MVVVVDELACYAFGILESKRCLRSDRLLLEGAMESFEFPIGLWVMG